MALYFTPTGNEAEDRRIRRMHEAGELERITNGLFFKQEGETKEIEIRRSWQRMVAKFVPGGVVTDRSGLETKPVQFAEASPHNIYVSAPRSRWTFELPGLSIHVRNGLGPVVGDIAYMGTHLAGQERRLLDNLAPSRARNGDGARTLGEAAVEAKLDEWCRTSGTEFLNGVRDRARHLAHLIDRETEFRRLNAIIGALLNTREDRMVTPQGRARAAGTPLDVACLGRFAKLAAYMTDRAPQAIMNSDSSPDRLMAGSFVEAYFSNYIEGTEFAVEQATEIVFEGKIPEDRPEDGHDVLGTYLQLVEPVARPPSRTTFEEFKDEIRTRHLRLMESRPGVKPGQFKTQSNRAGDTSFVPPELLEGTMKEAHAMMTSIDDPFRRAVFLHYMMAELHPFNDGNGRISRILMTRELLAAGLSRIVIPTVFRDDYVDSLRALSRRDEPSIFVRNLEFCQRVSAACSQASSADAIRTWATAYAFCENPRQARLTMPNPALAVTERNGVHAPDDYWAAISNQRGFGM
jgi:prophage maintenance system killer protein